MRQLEGRTVLIIGAGRDPGRGIAHRFAREGARLLLIDRDRDAGEALLAEFGDQAHLAVADPCEQLALTAAIVRLQAQVTHVDILVNAALEEPAWTRLEALDDAHFAHAFAQGFSAALWAMRALLPSMRANGGGRILNVGSVYGENVAEYIGGYAAASEALRSLTRTAAQEWGVDGIRVNLLMPTVYSERFRAYSEANREVVGRSLPLVALQRFGDPVEDIGGAALYLVSDDSCYITGYTIHADGGYHLAGPVYVPTLSD